MRCIEVTAPTCPLCCEGAVFTLKNKPGHPLRVSWLGGGGEGDSGRGGDETSAVEARAAEGEGRDLPACPRPPAMRSRWAASAAAAADHYSPPLPLHPRYYAIN